MPAKNFSDTISHIKEEIEAVRATVSQKQVNFFELLDRAEDLMISGLQAMADAPRGKYQKIARRLYQEEIWPLKNTILAEMSTRQLKALAKGGNDQAAWILAERYNSGVGVTKSWLKSNKKNYLHWREQGIQGNDTRKVRVATDHCDAGNYDRAIELLEEAVGKTDGYAECELSLRVYLDEDARPDIEKAEYYLTIAACEGHEVAMLELARIYISDDYGPEYDRAGFELLQKITKWEPEFSGNSTVEGATELLGLCYLSGWGTRINKPKAYKMFIQLGEDTFGENTIRIAEAYWNGVGVEKNIQLALKSLNKSRKRGNANAALILGDLYSAHPWTWEHKENEYAFQGIVGKNYKKAAKYYHEAAHSDWEQKGIACLRLGEAYYFGRGVQRNSKEARFWFEIARDEASLDFVREQATVRLEELTAG